MKVTPILDKSMIWIIALGLLLPTMHQSSLGSLMLIATHKVHQLWHTPLLPLLFLISCIAVGYAVVVFESIFSNRWLNRPIDKRMLASLSSAMVVVLFLYAAVRCIDILARGRFGLIFAFDSYSLLFFIEMALFLTPAFMLLSKKTRYDLGSLFRAAMMMIMAGGLYRVSVFWIAFNPGPGWAYFPTIPEMTITLGLIAFEILAYVYIVNKFPVFMSGGHAQAARAH
jgi:Ni/Fe-hydrogenase subunit HybB-like protein